MVHFKVVVIDDREIFANRERFPEADEVIVSEFEKCFDRLNIDAIPPILSSSPEVISTMVLCWNRQLNPMPVILV